MSQANIKVEQVYIAKLTPNLYWNVGLPREVYFMDEHDAKIFIELQRLKANHYSLEVSHILNIDSKTFKLDQVTISDPIDLDKIRI